MNATTTTAAQTSTAGDNRAKIAEIKGKLQAGQITYDEATEQANKVLEAINAKGKEIAKKYGKRYHAISSREILR